MYAEQKNIPLKDIRIKLTHNRDQHNHTSKTDRLRERVDTIDGDIELKGDLEPSQRRRMLEIAGKCWMHRTLSNGVTIRFHQLASNSPN
ncbi:MAG: OsmC family protein [Desulfobacterales bacterium]|nr:OsmC family protein [Desulfobacterales bacterium]